VRPTTGRTTKPSRSACCPECSTLVDHRHLQRFQQAENQAGLDEYQVRDWRAWYAPITLSMAAYAWLVVARTLRGNHTGRGMMIGYTVRRSDV
jgi:hypothetical protein